MLYKTSRLFAWTARNSLSIFGKKAKQFIDAEYKQLSISELQTVRITKQETAKKPCNSRGKILVHKTVYQQ